MSREVGRGGCSLSGYRWTIGPEFGTSNKIKVYTHIVLSGQELNCDRDLVRESTVGTISFELELWGYFFTGRISIEFGIDTCSANGPFSSGLWTSDMLSS